MSNKCSINQSFSLHHGPTSHNDNLSLTKNKLIKKIKSKKTNQKILQDTTNTQSIDLHCTETISQNDKVFKDINLLNNKSTTEINNLNLENYKYVIKLPNYHNILYYDDNYCYYVHYRYNYKLGLYIPYEHQHE